MVRHLCGNATNQNLMHWPIGRATSSLPTGSFLPSIDVGLPTARRGKSLTLRQKGVPKWLKPHQQERQIESKSRASRQSI